MLTRQTPLLDNTHSTCMYTDALLIRFWIKAIKTMALALFMSIPLNLQCVHAVQVEFVILIIVTFSAIFGQGRGGIRRGLVVTMPGSQAWVRKFESPLDHQAGWPGRYINVRRCGGLSMVLLQLKDPLALFVKSREFLLGSGFLSRRDMT